MTQPRAATAAWFRQRAQAAEDRRRAERATAWGALVAELALRLDGAQFGADVSPADALAWLRPAIQGRKIPRADLIALAAALPASMVGELLSDAATAARYGEQLKGDQ